MNKCAISALITIKKRLNLSESLLLLSQRADLNCRPLPYQGNALPLSYAGKKKRARDRVRTGDIQLGRLTLYQLSYSRIVLIHQCWY